MTTTAKLTPEEQAAERFRSETQHHVMTVEYDDGLYRRLKFANPRSPLYWFEIVTSPGQLVFSGDGESFVFRVAPDMFRLFRESASIGGINAGYWAEKCQTGNARTYSEAAFREQIEHAVAAAEGEFPGLREDVQEEILESLIYNIAYEAPAMMSAVVYSYTRGSREFRFRGTWEWDVKDFDWWYLFACHAIAWGIRQYDAAKAPVAPVVLPPVCALPAGTTVAQFNAAYEVGTPVVIYPGFRRDVDPKARAIVTRTKSAAWLANGRTPVVMVEDYGSWVALTHVDVTAGGGE